MTMIITFHRLPSQTILNYGGVDHAIKSFTIWLVPLFLSKYENYVLEIDNIHVCRIACIEKIMLVASLQS